MAVGVVSAAVAIATLIVGLGGWALDKTRRKGNQRARTANAEKDIVMGKKMGKSRDKALRKIYDRQITAIRWGRMPLMEKVNSFNYNVNKDSAFAPLWVESNLLGSSNRGQRKLSICKSKIKIAELKNKNIGKLNKLRKKKDEIIEEYGKGPMKEMGWIESITKSAGGKYLNQLKGYGPLEGGTHARGEDYEVRYQMAATSDDTKGYDPGDLFQKAQSQFRNNLPTTRATFKRFGVNYPITEGLVPDRFVVGNNKTIFNVSKLIILANACSKISEDPDLQKVQVIDESQSKNSDKVKYLTRSQFAQYVSAYVSSESGKKGLEDLKEIDGTEGKSQAEAIQNTLKNYVKAYKTDIEK